MLVILNVLRSTKAKEHSNDLRTVIIQHYQNGHSLRGIAVKTSLPRSIFQYMVDKYKSTKCIINIFDHGRKRKTTSATESLL